MDRYYSRKLINAKVTINGRSKITKVLKLSIYTVENYIIHHLIGNVYYTLYTNDILDNVIELKGRCISPFNYQIK